MSLTRRFRFSSAVRRSSTTLRCCRVACALAWSCQKLGSLVFASSAASCRRAGSTSKKTPHDVDAFLQFGEAVLQILDVLSHPRIVTAKIKIRKSKVGPVDED